MDQEIKVLAKAVVEEEAQRVAELQRWIQRHLSGDDQPHPATAVH
ncbi:MAG TPA: hypothetical protein VIK56_06840 [Rhodoferax sp.]